MKKIINQKRYDTDTAKNLGCCEYSHPGDFNWTAETLYQKRTGEFFLHGEGGAASKYAEAVGQNSWAGGERIMPLSFEDAREWAEENLEADAYESIFGEVSEDGEKKTIGLSLPASVVEKLRTEAGKSGQTMSDIVAGLVEKMDARKMRKFLIYTMDEKGKVTVLGLHEGRYWPSDIQNTPDLCRKEYGVDFVEIREITENCNVALGGSYPR